MKILSDITVSLVAVLAALFTFSAQAQPSHYESSAAGANQVGFVLSSASGTNLFLDKFTLEQTGPNSNNVTFATQLSPANAGNSNVVWGFRFGISPNFFGDTLFYVTNACPSGGAGSTATTLNLIPCGQARYIVCTTNWTTQTNAVTINTGFGQFHPPATVIQ